MALLCTLHADGPKTLRLLREAGCTNLEKLASFGPERLARLLCLAPASARRLLREAGLLHERLDPTLEREEVMYPPAASAVAVKPPPPGSVQFEEGEPEEVALSATELALEARPVLSSRAGLDLRDRALLDKVIDRWRTDDDLEPPTPAPRAPRRAPEALVIVPAPGLSAGDLTGLDEATCAVLRTGGVNSLEELATCPIDELILRTGLSFTRARSLQFFAGRALSVLGGIASEGTASEGTAAEGTAAEGIASEGIASEGTAAEQPAAVPAEPVRAPERSSRSPHGAPATEPRAPQRERLSPAAPQRQLLSTDRFGGEAEEGAGGPFA